MTTPIEKAQAALRAKRGAAQEKPKKARKKRAVNEQMAIAEEVADG